MATRSAQERLDEVRKKKERAQERLERVRREERRLKMMANKERRKKRDRACFTVGDMVMEITGHDIAEIDPDLLYKRLSAAKLGECVSGTEEENLERFGEAHARLSSLGGRAAADKRGGSR